jgi:uncharacterized membrane protein YphA (DoxX/SURF4 family)
MSNTCHHYHRRMPPPAAAIFSLLLILTGIAKLRRPSDTARALRSMNIPVPRLTTTLVASVEVSVGTGALVLGSSLFLGMQGGLYAVFLAWVAAALVKGVPIASCGCLGREDTPPYWGHLILNGIGVAASAAAAISGQLSVTGLAETAALVLIVGVGTALGWTILDEGARISGLVTR